MLSFSLILFLFTTMVSIVFISKKAIKNDNSNILAILFLLVNALYVLPLPLRVFFIDKGNLIDGDISPILYSFVDYLPFALVLVSIFVVVFSLSYYIAIKTMDIAKNYSPNSRKVHKLFWFFYILLFIISMTMLWQLAQDSGGLLRLILSGYGVTEKLIGQQHFAIAFEWLLVLGVVLFSLPLKNPLIKKISIAILIIILLSFVIMGRRGLLVVLILSVLFVYHFNVKKIKPSQITVLGAVLFVGLNIVGLLRGDSYDDISSVVNIFQNKSEQFSSDGTFQNNIFYTLTTGNFAVPFETFPNIISSFGNNFSFGFGAYSLKSILLIIPNFIFADRPLPLSNWYMQVFYGVSEMNIGRQFYFLTAPYMDFGVFGVAIFGVIYGVFFAWLSNLMIATRDNALYFVAIALFAGNMLNFVANDFMGFAVVFFKNSLILILLLALINKKIRL